MQVIGVCGYAQHGKDTFAARLVERHGYTRFAFADALKSMALALNPFVECEQQQPNRLAGIVREYGWEGAKRREEVRRFLQVLGTEGVRAHLGEDSWVNACALSIERSGVERAVITDVRFPNEAAWVASVGGSMVRVTRPGFDNGVGTAHASEAYIAELPVDFTVRNDARLIDLYERADAVARDVEEGFGHYATVCNALPVSDELTTEYEALVRRYQGEGL